MVYHSSLVRLTPDALQISLSRFGLVVPTMGCILAGCLRSHAIAMAVLVTPLICAISSIWAFNSGNLSLSRNTPSKIHIERETKVGW